MRNRPLEEREYPDPDDEDDSSDLVACPSCKEWIYEDAEQCPRCGAYVSWENDRFLAGKPVWYVVLALLGILAVVSLSFL